MTNVAFSLLTRVRRSRITVQLAVLSAAVTAIVVTLAFVAAGMRLRATARRELATELARTQRTVLALHRQNLDQLQVAAGVVAQSAGIRSAIETYRTEVVGGGTGRAELTTTVERELRRTAQDLGKALLLATDEQGHVFAAVVLDGRPPAPGTSIVSLGAVRQALDPDVRADSGDLSVLRLGDRYYQVGVVPVVLRGYTIGSLLLGDRLDSTLVRSLRSVFDGELAITVGDSVLVATGGAGAHLRDPAYVTAALPLGTTQNGVPVRLYLLYSLAARVTALTRPLAIALTLYGALAVLLAIAGAALLSRSALRPLSTFVQHMHDAAASETIDVPMRTAETSVEIRVLNETFQRLMRALARRRDVIEERSAQLAAANAVLTDEIHERERVEQALRQSEAQLRQSQKLEAVGTLAGGIAHDFNNLLTVISGYSQLALMRAGKPSPVAEDLKQVVDATGRASHLTQQLLAFSRKQVLQPRVLDLSEVITAIAPMLRRLIGEHIALEIRCADDPARIRADRGQLEQVIVNLAVNARDAMPFGGTLTIATSMRDAARGRAVVLSVSDTGTGMSAETRERIFEPFFTTKEAGKGTGLGLATVYGIVTQSGGSIDVESVLGAGTTFVITFPLVVEYPHASEPVADDAEPARGSETILVVEDEDAVRALARDCLEHCGYTVLTARNAVEALDVARRERRRIDLLLTDVVMPQLSGPQLAERFRVLRRDALVAYMSGYADDAIHHLELDAGTAFLRKPFTPATLARFVRDTFDASKQTVSPSPSGARA